MNRNYGKLNESGAITYAPNNIRIGETIFAAPTAAQYMSAGWFPIVDERPAAREGYYAVPTGYEDDSGVIRRVYEERAVEPPAPPVIRYSKLKLIVSAKAAGKWVAFKTFISSAGLEDEWAACQFLASDYPQFEAAKSAIIAAGIATAEEIEEILAASVDEEVR